MQLGASSHSIGRTRPSKFAHAEKTWECERRRRLFLQAGFRINELLGQSELFLEDSAPVVSIAPERTPVRMTPTEKTPITPAPPGRPKLASAFAGLACLAALLGPALADSPPAPQAASTSSAPSPNHGAAKDEASLIPADSVTRHAIEADGRRLAYTATAGTLPLFGQRGEIAARAFYVAYTLDTVSARPVTFVFNGGPGAASAFLHLGAMGPRVVNFADNGGAPALPVRLVDNPDSWLDFTDLVFIDPVGTGYSRATTGGEEAERAFFGVEKDADAMSEMARLYLNRAERSLAPVFLAGESYGGFRAVLLADRLLRAGVRVKGAVLISPALDFATLLGHGYNPLPLALDLPSIAASHFEQRDGANGSLDQLREVESFARGPYLLHLAAGMKPDEAVAAAVARYTGLDQETVARRYARVSPSFFVAEYTKKHSRFLSRYDGTVSAAAPRLHDHMRYDPILDGAVNVLTPAVTQYARQELGLHTDLAYNLLNRNVSSVWDYGVKSPHQGYASALDELQEARVRNPALRMLVVHGYTDLVTTYGATQFLIDQLPPIEGASPIALRVHRGGHMMYLRPGSRRLLKEDARELYGQAGD